MLWMVVDLWEGLALMPSPEIENQYKSPVATTPNLEMETVRAPNHPSTPQSLGIPTP